MYQIIKRLKFLKLGLLPWDQEIYDALTCKDISKTSQASKEEVIPIETEEFLKPKPTSYSQEDSSDIIYSD